MIVTCEQCATQFQLDDSKVPVGGVRVRCSRCKHAFFIEPAGAEIPQSPLDRAAQAALDAHAPPAPEVSEDLAGPEPAAGSEFDDGNDLAGEGDIPDESEVSDESEISDESDWEFNEDRFRGKKSGADAQAAADDFAREAIDDLLGSRPAPSSPSPQSAGESVSPSAVFASDDDSGEEELGSPDSWDLLAGDAPSSLAPASAELASDVAPVVSPPQREPLRSVVAGAARPAIEEWIDPSEPSRLLAWIARSGHALGWGVTVTLFALVAFATLGPGLSPDAEPALGTQRLAQLEAQGIAGRWVENVAAGPLFVVSGRLVNPTARARPLGALAGVRLLDASGTRLVGETAALGPVLAPSELREVEPSSLQARQLEGGRLLAATSIEPGQSLAFEAVLAAVPAAASRFVLEPIHQGRAQGRTQDREQGREQDGDAPLAAANGPAPAR